MTCCYLALGLTDLNPRSVKTNERRLKHHSST